MLHSPQTLNIDEFSRSDLEVPLDSNGNIKYLNQHCDSFPISFEDLHLEQDMFSISTSPSVSLQTKTRSTAVNINETIFPYIALVTMTGILNSTGN